MFVLWTVYGGTGGTGLLGTGGVAGTGTGTGTGGAGVTAGTGLVPGAGGVGTRKPGKCTVPKNLCSASPVYLLLYCYTPRCLSPPFTLSYLRPVCGELEGSGPV